MTDPIPFEDAEPHMDALATNLADLGATRTGAWARAFAVVPRHMLVPYWYEMETNEEGFAVWRLTQGTVENLESVYSNRTLVTALDPATKVAVGDAAWTGVATSSSSQPSLMAGMLEDLSVQDGDKVLEIGTGTGYNAALLCERLGSSKSVFSVDIDPALIDAAGRRLSSIGYEPHLSAADGQNGFPAGEQFDCVIATCSVPGIPPSWVRQTRPGGVIVADVSLGIAGGLVRLEVDDQGFARGYFTSNSGQFMEARSEARVYSEPKRPKRAPEKESRDTVVSATEINTNYPYRLLLALHLPNTELVYYSDDHSGAMSLQLQRTDGSWARVPLDGTGTVTFGGDPALWLDVEAAWEWWNRAGRPSHELFSYQRRPDGAEVVSYTLEDRSWPIVRP
ncbi:methyltransferase domain-containing protein [Streptomyces sp. NPDC056500]|uniref:methyltransferase domain-containing protein n=1 Tax=Streptomyces sp. NPDC056500 TaxID=3345840 RepID=UPI00368F8F70